MTYVAKHVDQLHVQIAKSDPTRERWTNPDECGSKDAKFMIAKGTYLSSVLI